MPYPAGVKAAGGVGLLRRTPTPDFSGVGDLQDEGT